MAETTLRKIGGVVTMDKPFDYLCSLLRNGTYSVKITRKTAPRTLSQNSLMWLWYTCMEESTGTDKDTIHSYYKAKFLRREITINGKVAVIVESTSNLNSAQMTAFLDKVKADAATEFGINLPLPEDMYYNEFVEEYKNR